MTTPWLSAAARSRHSTVSTPSATINGKNYAYAGGNPIGGVSIGKFDPFNNNYRQLHNVAAGRVSSSSTDGINGSQLYAAHEAIQALSDNSVQYDDASRTTVTLNPGGGSATTITNVAAGVNDSDAVNMSQLNTTNANVTNLDGRRYHHLRHGHQVLPRQLHRRGQPGHWRQQRGDRPERRGHRRWQRGTGPELDGRRSGRDGRHARSAAPATTSPAPRPSRR